jgi:hypothetical protein
MVENLSLTPWAEYERKLAQTQARRAELQAKDAELGVFEGKLARTIEVLKDTHASMAMASIGDDMVKAMESLVETQKANRPPQIGPDSPFYGKPLPECAVIVIRNAGKALSETEIVEGLRAGGVQIISNDPGRNVRRSMLRRPDILQVVEKKWVVIETPVSIENLPQKCLVNNFSEKHAQSTRSGIEAAKARGVAWGRTPVLTPDKEETLLAMRQDGCNANEICELLEISRGTYFKYLSGKGLTKKYNLKEGQLI